MPHPVLARIDRENPYFIRKLTRRLPDGDHDCELHIWLPVQMDDGCWLSAVHITNIGLPPISAMPGGDPLGAILGAVAFARNVVDAHDGIFFFADSPWEGAGLPVTLDRGFSPKQLVAIEAEALATAEKAAQIYHDWLINGPPGDDLDTVDTNTR